MLDLVNVSAAYGRVIALRRVSFSVSAGTCGVVVGLSGAGKSTLLRAVSGLGVNAYGEMRFEGNNLMKTAAWHRAHIGIAHVPERRRIFLTLTVEENLLVSHIGARAGLVERLDEVYSSFPELADRRNAIAGNLSGGQQQMLAIGRALMADARLLMMDEPFLGLAPIIMETLAESISKLKSGSRAILITEERPILASVAADRIFALERGQITQDLEARRGLQMYHAGELFRLDRVVEA